MGEELLTGSVVEYQDETGQIVNALVVHVHSDSVINLVYVRPGGTGVDTYGNERVLKTSVQLAEGDNTKERWTFKKDK